MFWYCLETDRTQEFQDKLHIAWQGHVFFEDWAHTFAKKYYWKYLESLMPKALGHEGWIGTDVLPGIRAYGTVITLNLAIKLQKMEIALL